MSSSVMTLPSHMAGFLHELGPPSSGVYSFVSYPSALTLPNRPKYRNEQSTGGSSQGDRLSPMHYGHIGGEFDKRFRSRSKKDRLER